jgi:hypothetical protein
MGLQPEEGPDSGKKEVGDRLLALLFFDQANQEEPPASEGRFSAFG